MGFGSHAVRGKDQPRPGMQVPCSGVFRLPARRGRARFACDPFPLLWRFPMAIGERTAASLQDLVAVALEIRASLADGAFMWFRGLNCHRHQLLPKIMREGREVSMVFERELRLLTRFRQRGLAYWPAGYPQNDWEHLFAMQHYGLPTRLLDWSENLFVAAFFALSSGSDHRHDPEGCSPTIWCLDPVRWNRCMPGLSEYGDTIGVLTTADDELDAYRPITGKKRFRSPVAMFGAHNSDRIVAQRGTFTVWGNEVSPMEDFAASVGHEVLWRITLTGDRASPLTATPKPSGLAKRWCFPN